MQTIEFALRAVIQSSSPLLANQIALELQPVWSVVERRSEASPSGSTTVERVLACGATADKAYPLLVALTTAYVTGQKDFDRIVAEWLRANTGVAIGARKTRNRKCANRAM